jgi:hypothetical protein
MSAGRDRHPLFTGGAPPVDFKIGYPAMRVGLHLVPAKLE